MERGAAPKMLDEPSKKLVGYLAHPNGWWRDNAQKELIVRNDQSVIPVLKAIAAGEQNDAISAPSALARLHALWTLEGLGGLNKEVIQGAMKDSDAGVRKAAVRMTEPYLKNDQSLVASLAALKTDPSPDVRMQLVFSLAFSPSGEAKVLAAQIVSASYGTEVIARAPRSIDKNEDAKKFGMRLGRLDAPDRELVMNGSVIYKSLCATCHGADGKGLISKTAPRLTGSRRLNRSNTHAAIRILLHGLSGPIDGNTYPTEMPSMKDNDDQWIASVLSYVRHEFTNSPPVRPADVKVIREQTASQDRAFTLDELSIQ